MSSLLRQGILEKKHSLPNFVLKSSVTIAVFVPNVGIFIGFLN